MDDEGRRDVPVDLVEGGRQGEPFPLRLRVRLEDVVLGVYLVVAAVRKFRGRPRAGEEGAMPKWMDGIAAFGPGRSLGAGLALGAGNPKNVVVGLAAAVTIASVSLSNGQQIAAIAIYVFVAVLGVAAPILVTIFLGDRSHEVLDGWKAWLGQNNAAVVSVLFLIFGVVLIAQAIGAA
jgi:threonine/homoserine/homoserine lactone efflux protein